MRKKVAEYLLDVSKLVLAGVVLTTIIDIESFSKIYILITGIIGAFSTAVVGFLMLRED